MLVRSLRSSFIDSFSSAKKRCNTSQGFGAFCRQPCDRDRFLFPFTSEFLSLSFLFLDFTAISDCVFNNKNIIPLGLAGYEIIITILALLSYPARPRCTQICVYPRTFITLRVALEFVKNVFAAERRGQFQ